MGTKIERKERRRKKVLRKLVQQLHVDSDEGDSKCCSQGIDPNERIS